MKYGLITAFLFAFLLTGTAFAADVSFDFKQGNINTDEYLTVTYTGLISGADASGDDQWEWNFGDGSPAGFGRTVVHTYDEKVLSVDMNNPVEFMVRLDVRTDEKDGERLYYTTKKVSLEEPTLSASFVCDVSSGDLPLTVTFTDTTHGRHNIVEWDFGDLSDKSAVSPVTFTFLEERTYPVVLKVSRGAGEVSKTTKDIVVRKPGPVVSFKSDVSRGRAPLAVYFTDTSTITSGEISGREWDFGDSTPKSSEQNPKHIYEKPGDYTVVLTLTGNGRTASDKIMISVKNLAASFYADKTSGDESLSVQFTSSSSGDINSYYWDFGDGYFSTEKDPQHTFYNAGTYDISLTVFGPDGSDISREYDYINVLESGKEESEEKSGDLDTTTGFYAADSASLPDLTGVESSLPKMIRDELSKFYNFIMELFSITKKTGEEIHNSTGLFIEK